MNAERLTFVIALALVAGAWLWISTLEFNDLLERRACVEHSAHEHVDPLNASRSSLSHEPFELDPRLEAWLEQR